MKAVTLLFLLAFTVALSAQDPAPSPAAGAASEAAAQTLARSRALELAGAFANEGYKVRDGIWAGALEAGKPQFLEVNVFAGNEYWFSAATQSPINPTAQLTLTLFGENGKPLEQESYEDGTTVAAGLETEWSGKVYVKIELTDAPRADFCLVYSYK